MAQHREPDVAAVGRIGAIAVPDRVQRPAVRRQPGLGLGKGVQVPGGAERRAVHYKMTTPIAPGVAVPDRVETSIGTLNLHYGYPDEETTQKV